MLQKPAVIIPVIHLNSSSAKTLIEDLEKVYDALVAAHKAFQAGCPHQRDYYVREGLYAQARAQYDRRLKTLALLQLEILQELEGIQEQTRKSWISHPQRRTR